MKILNSHVLNDSIAAIDKKAVKAFTKLSVCLDRVFNIRNSFVRMDKASNNISSKFHVNLCDYGSSEANPFKGIKFNFTNTFESNSSIHNARGEPIYDVPPPLRDEPIYAVPRISENIKKITTAIMRYPSLQKTIVSCVSSPSPQKGILSEAICLNKENG